MEKEELYRYVYSDYGDRLVKECINVEKLKIVKMNKMDIRKQMFESGL